MFEVPQFRGRLPSPGKLNQISDLTERLMNSRLAGGGQIGTFGILTADQLSESFWARITDNDGGNPPAHSWVQIVETEATVYETQSDGMYGDKVNLPLYDINGALIPNNVIVRCWRGQGDYYLTFISDETAWIKPTTASSSTITLGRTITDGVLVSGQSSLGSVQADFSPDDAGRTITGTGIPGGTTILTVLDSQTVQMSNSATSSGSGLTVTIKSGTATGYTSDVELWSNTTGTWSDASEGTVWFIGINGETPIVNNRYLCKQLGVDADGVAIWGRDIEGGSGIALWYNGILGSGGSYVEESTACSALYGDQTCVITFAPYLGYQLSVSLSSGSTIVTNCSTDPGSFLGLVIQGFGIPAGTTIVSRLSSTSFTISNAATITANDVFCFVSGNPGSGQIIVAPASPIRWGVMTNAAQTFAGVKEFQDNVNIDGVLKVKQGTTGQIAIGASQIVFADSTGLASNGNSYISFGGGFLGSSQEIDTILRDVPSGAQTNLFMPSIGTSGSLFSATPGWVGITNSRDSSVFELIIANDNVLFIDGQPPTPRITIRNHFGYQVGQTGTGGGGDTITGGIVTSLGSGPASIDGGTWT